MNTILYEWFNSVDQNRSGKIDSKELGSALSAGGEKFEKGVTEQMIKMFDLNGDKEIDKKEFISLFGYIQRARRVFDYEAKYHQGTIPLESLLKCLDAMRFNIKPSDELLLKLFTKFDTNQSFSLSNFDQFLHMCLWLGEQKSRYQTTKPKITFDQHLWNALK